MQSSAQAFRNRQAFTEALVSIQETLQQEGIEYRVIGSIATAAYTGCEIDFDRVESVSKARRMPDVDIIAPREAAPWLRAYRDRLYTAAFPIALGLAPLTTIDFRPDQTESYLQFGTMRTSLDSELLKTVQQTFYGAPISTVYPRTLLHTYVTVGGQMRHRDIGKVRSLHRQEFPEQPSELNYRSFHTFIRYRCRYANIPVPR